MTWFRSYLTDRTQTFVVGEDKHGPLPVNCSVPQGSVLGPIKFISYTEDVSELITNHAVSYHLFADDKQLYTAVSQDEIHVGRQRLMSCISDLQEWCASRRLQLNASKTELIWFGSQTSLRQLSLADSTLMIDSVVVQPTDVVRDLGVLLDSELSLKQHVNRTASTCFYHLRRLRQLKRHVNIDVMKRLISAFVFSQLGYYNGILSGLPLSTIAPLQRVQNAAARLVLGLSWSDHVRPALKELHWLPVVYRIKFKLVLVMFTIHTHQCPDYLTDSVHPYSNNDPARYRLRSATGTN